jgi:tetratricopeptide (TPR) repeat protein
MRALAPRTVERWNSAGEMGRAIRALPPLAVAPAPPLATIMPSHPLHGYEDLIAQARTFLDQERWQEAQKAARRAVEADRGNPIGHKMQGIVFARSRPPDAGRALAAYQESLVLNPNDAETYRLIGDVHLFLQQKPADAVTAYQKALRLNPGDYETHRFLGMCFEQTNQTDFARGEYAEAVRLAPHYVPAHMSYGQLMLRLGQWTEAERAFVEALRLNPALPVARHLLAQVYERQGRMNEAMREAEYAIQVDPRDIGAIATLNRLRRNSRSIGKRNPTRPLGR